ncbi:hypothetical protein AMJ40_00355 [candidate division TA06 bacterium DG_26]|uniref:Aminotransferase n=1 Tax=candidate division TA06 bacterium DG_26 TaxID=1703771 RepID=A0A0S7WMA1_UNCT6|nr:MAG: hypothetical protein AMJ40_00355 [candidate division TA06 bacterium DG_26]
MDVPDEDRFEQAIEDTDDRDALLEAAWRCMPEGLRGIVSGTPIIPSVVTRAKLIASQNPDFIRSDQGQIVGVFPDKEIYYGPSAGIEKLRDLIARFWTHAYRLRDTHRFSTTGLHGENVSIVSGATEGLAIVLRIFAHNGNLGIMRLHWSNYPNLIRSAGGTPVVVDLFDANYRMDLEAAERTVTREKITCLLINFPTNPSGDVLSREEIEHLARFAERLNLIIISDEVYSYLRYRGEPQSMLAFAPERTVVISSASKEYLIPGARVGYVISANRTFANAWIPKLIRSTSSSANVLGQRVLIDLLQEEVRDLERGRVPSKIAKIREELSARRDLLISILKEHGFTLAGRDTDYPSGGISILAKLPDNVAVDDVTFVEKALSLKKFSAIPGSVFGAPGCLRFGYGGMPRDTIERLGRNLKEFLDVLQREAKQ